MNKLLSIIFLSSRIWASPQELYFEKSDDYQYDIQVLVDKLNHLENKLDILAEHLNFVYSSWGYPNLLRMGWFYDDANGIHFVPAYRKWVLPEDDD